MGRLFFFLFFGRMIIFMAGDFLFLVVFGLEVREVGVEVCGRLEENTRGDVD